LYSFLVLSFNPLPFSIHPATISSFETISFETLTISFTHKLQNFSGYIAPHLKQISWYLWFISIKRLDSNALLIESDPLIFRNNGNSVHLKFISAVSLSWSWRGILAIFFSERHPRGCLLSYLWIWEC
jgi:hypothetical protein